MKKMLTKIVADQSWRILPKDSPDSVSVSDLFHENSKIKDVPTLEGRPNVPADEYTRKAIQRGFKRYARARSVTLEKVDTATLNVPFHQVISDRRTVRKFSFTELSFKEFSNLSGVSFGYSKAPDDDYQNESALRTYPSPGGLYPVEIFCIVRNVERIDNGIYYYNPQSHHYSEVVLGDLSDALPRLTCFQQEVSNAAAIFIASICPERVTQKYGDRGYRYCLLEAGHAFQNFYLAATAMSLAVMTSGGFLDDELNDLLRHYGVGGACYLGLVGPRKR